MLHKFGIVHRDLKLENVLIKASGHVTICDFGTSKCLKRTKTDGAPPLEERLWTKSTATLAFTKSIIGTPAYARRVRGGQTSRRSAAASLRSLEERGTRPRSDSSDGPGDAGTWLRRCCWSSPTTTPSTGGPSE